MFRGITCQMMICFFFFIGFLTEHSFFGMVEMKIFNYLIMTIWLLYALHIQICFDYINSLGDCMKWLLNVVEGDIYCVVVVVVVCWEQSLVFHYSSISFGNSWRNHLSRCYYCFVVACSSIEATNGPASPIIISNSSRFHIEITLINLINQKIH